AVVGEAMRFRAREGEAVALIEIEGFAIDLQLDRAREKKSQFLALVRVGLGAGAAARLDHHEEAAQPLARGGRGDILADTVDLEQSRASAGTHDIAALRA